MTYTCARESYGDLVARLFEKVKSHTGWSNEKVCVWFRTKNPLCGGITPDEFIMRRPNKAERWIDAVIAGDGI